MLALEPKAIEYHLQFSLLIPFLYTRARTGPVKSVVHTVPYPSVLVGNKILMIADEPALESQNTGRCWNADRIVATSAWRLNGAQASLPVTTIVRRVSAVSNPEDRVRWITMRTVFERHGMDGPWGLCWWLPVVNKTNDT